MAGTRRQRDDDRQPPVLRYAFPHTRFGLPHGLIPAAVLALDAVVRVSAGVVPDGRTQLLDHYRSDRAVVDQGCSDGVAPLVTLAGAL